MQKGFPNSSNNQRDIRIPFVTHVLGTNKRVEVRRHLKIWIGIATKKRRGSARFAMGSHFDQRCQINLLLLEIDWVKLPSLKASIGYFTEVINNIKLHRPANALCRSVQFVFHIAGGFGQAMTRFFLPEPKLIGKSQAPTDKT